MGINFRPHSNSCSHVAGAWVSPFVKELCLAIFVSFVPVLFRLCHSEFVRSRVLLGSSASTVFLFCLFCYLLQPSLYFFSES